MSGCRYDTTPTVHLMHHYRNSKCILDKFGREETFHACGFVSIFPGRGWHFWIWSASCSKLDFRSVFSQTKWNRNFVPDAHMPCDPRPFLQRMHFSNIRCGRASIGPASEAARRRQKILHVLRLGAAPIGKSCSFYADEICCTRSLPRA